MTKRLLSNCYKYTGSNLEFYILFTQTCFQGHLFVVTITKHHHYNSYRKDSGRNEREARRIFQVIHMCLREVDKPSVDSMWSPISTKDDWV